MSLVYFGGAFSIELPLPYDLVPVLEKLYLLTRDVLRTLYSQRLKVVSYLHIEWLIIPNIGRAHNIWSFC